MGLLISVMVFSLGQNIGSAAGTLRITTPPEAKTVDQNISIKAITSDLKRGVVINFKAKKPDGLNPNNFLDASQYLKQKTCTTDSTGSCSVIFNASTPGDYIFTVSTPITTSGNSSGRSEYTPTESSPLPVTSGKNLTVTANPTTVKSRQNSTITVTLPEKKSDVLITFPNIQESVIADQGCKTDINGICKVTFNQTNYNSLGNVTIVARASGYVDGSTVITVVRDLPAQTPPAGTTPTATEGGNSELNYKLLEPIENISSFDASNSSFANYLNTMIKIFIGLCAVLAMVMIVVGGLEYMTTELISHKDEGKKRITEALFGLLLALGAYMILNTINPDLLITEPKIDQATLVVLGEDIETAPPVNFAANVPSGSVGTCTEGAVRISTQNGPFTVCKSISIQLGNMIQTAWAHGVIISGGGLRSTAEQIRLRRQNCGGDERTKPPSACNPPTAIPGTSRHESGLAVDLKCTENGVTKSIQTTDNKCFLWLRENAGSYGFRNLPGEPWHWSVDGK